MLNQVSYLLSSFPRPTGYNTEIIGRNVFWVTPARYCRCRNSINLAAFAHLCTIIGQLPSFLANKGENLDGTHPDILITCGRDAIAGALSIKVKDRKSLFSGTCASLLDIFTSI